MFYFGPSLADGYRWVFHITGSQRFGVVVSMEVTKTMVETFTAVPVTGWGEMYFVMALKAKFSVTVMTGNYKNVIIFKLMSEEKNFTLNVNGIQHKSEERFTILLTPFTAYAVSHCRKHQTDGFITGSKLRAVLPFGVISGNCFDRGVMNCNKKFTQHFDGEVGGKPLAEMLLPTKTAGTCFILFPVGSIDSKAGDYIIVNVNVAYVELSIASDLHSARVEKFTLQKTGEWRTYEAKYAMLSSTGPVEVVFIQNSMCGPRYELGHSMMLMIPYHLFYYMYIVTAHWIYHKNYMVLVIPSEYIQSLHILSEFNRSSTLRETIYKPETVHGFKKHGYWTVYKYRVETNTSFVVASTRIRFGYYIYGISPDSTYMHPAGFISSNINKNMCKKNLLYMWTGDLADNDCDGYVDEDIHINKNDDGKNPFDAPIEDAGFYFSDNKTVMSAVGIYRANHLQDYILNSQLNYSTVSYNPKLTTRRFYQNTKYFKDEDLEFIDGYSEWSNWNCVQECNKNIMIRTRKCIEPVIVGHVCRAATTNVKEALCYNIKCPADCPDYTWSAFCNHSCSNCIKPCNKFTGICDSCKPGFENPRKSCMTSTPVNKKEKVEEKRNTFPLIYLLFLLVPVVAVAAFLLLRKMAIPTNGKKTKSKESFKSTSIKEELPEPLSKATLISGLNDLVPDIVTEI